MTDDDREWRSWREIDRMRDRGGIAKLPKTLSQKEGREKKTETRVAKQELEKLFSSSSVSKEKEGRVKHIQSLRGKPKYYEALTQYYKDYGVPKKWDEQMLFLDHKDAALVLMVLEELKKTAPLQALEKQKILGTKLRILSMSTFDSKLLNKIKEVQAAILSA